MYRQLGVIKNDSTILSMNKCLTDGCMVGFLLQGGPYTGSLCYKGGCINM